MNYGVLLPWSPYGLSGHVVAGYCYMTWHLILSGLKLDRQYNSASCNRKLFRRFRSTNT